MKNSVLYIVGALALLGGGAFLFLKNKKAKDTSKLKDIALETANIGVGTKSSDAVTKDNSKNVAEAINLATEIADLKAKKLKFTIMPNSEFSNTDEGQNGFWATNQNVLKQLKESTLLTISNQIKALNEKIVALGYMEVNGGITKIN